MKFAPRIIFTALGALAAVVSPPSFADDSEVFTSSSFTVGSGVRPNVLFVIDTSGSMDSDVLLYDETATYTGACDSSSLYWVKTTATDSVPAKTICDTKANQVSTLANRCRAAYLSIQQDGWYHGRFQQISDDGKSWVDLMSTHPDNKLECQGDNGVHGDLDPSLVDGGSNLYPRNGSSTTRWGKNGSTGQLSWTSSGGRPYYSFYSGNYVNWLNQTTPTGRTKTRLQIVQEVATKTIEGLSGVNLGLMRYSRDADGGMVTYPVSELTATTKVDMEKLINGYTAGGNTPLSETFFEAYHYLHGDDVDYGTDSTDENGKFPSVAGSRVGADINSKKYDSPMDFSCQKTFIVYLTDGLPTSDTDASSDIQNLLDKEYVLDPVTNKPTTTKVGDKCDDKGPDGTDNGECMVQLAGYMQRQDMRPDAEVIGLQNVTTYVIGFGSEIATSKDYLDRIATAGGGTAYTQSDVAGLTAALEEIFSQVADNSNTTFVSPTVAVNAFNRTRNLNTLFVSVFAPTNRQHWPGNVKKYQLLNGVIYGTNTSTPAVDPAKGFFAAATKDMFNSDVPADGPKVPEGGVASNLPLYTARNVYTYLGANADLTNAVNNFDVTNTAIDNSSIGLAALATVAQRTDVIEFTRGRDVNDENNDKSFIDTRKAMGDPMHSRPAVAIYRGTETAPDGVVYTTTNDGMLHSFDMNTGKENWAFIPQEFMGRLAGLQKDRVTASRSYGVDGDVRVFKYDVNSNGIIDAGDKMYIVFGFGRGGAGYYALDVTNEMKPVFLWRKTSADLPMLGQAWSAPVITRVNVNSSKQTDPQKFVLIFGAGYDVNQENYDYSPESVGNGIYMLELATGNLLWSAGKTGTSGVNWSNDRMLNSIPAEISVLDLNGDGYADRMYAGDMGGRIWRFDIWHGQAPGTLVTGGLFAALGAGEMSSGVTRADARRFYYAPDTSFVTPRGGAPYINIAIGSGYRGHPLETDIHDRFYSLRDYSPFTRRTNSSFASPGWSPIADGALVDVTLDVNTVVSGGSNGWKIQLNGNGWRGEKVLAESVTADGVIFFPTFTPTGVDPRNPCLATTLNRSWAVYLDSARPYGIQDSALPANDPRRTDDPTDRYDSLVQGGIAPGTAIIQTPDDKTVCLNGVEAKKCVSIGDVTRTFWERRQ